MPSSLGGHGRPVGVLLNVVSGGFWVAAILLLSACAGGGGGGSSDAAQVPGISGQTAGGYTYQLYVPPGHDAAVPAPLVLAMHGTGGNGGQEIARWRSVADAEGVLVLAPNYRDNGTYFDAAGEQALFEMLALVEQDYGVDRTRRYLAGVSTGGTWSYFFGIDYADHFAAASVFAGGYTTAGDNAFVVAGAPRQIPFWLTHGVQDGTLPVANARDAHNALDAAGHPVQYVEHGGGHSVPATAAQDAWQFMRTWSLPVVPPK